MQANPKTLAQLVTSVYQFRIPEFQRPFAWTQEYVEQLWNDLSEAYAEFVSKGSPPEGEDYFLGPIVIANERDTRGRIIGHVVDGQQRLTSLHALLWLMLQRLAGRDSEKTRDAKEEIKRLVLTAASETTLQVAREDQANFRCLREGRQQDETTLFGQCVKYLAQQLAQWPVVAELANFFYYLENQVNFVLVESDSYSSAWTLFIGLNGKGRALNPADLIKAFVCGRSEDGRAMADIWNDKILPLGNDSTSAILDITRMTTGEVGSEAKLFRTFSRGWDSHKLSAAVLASAAHTYQYCWHASLEKIPDLGNGRRSLRGLRELDRRDHTTAILAVAEKCGQSAAFRRQVLHALESFQLWMAIRGKHGKERPFTALANAVYSELDSGRDALRRLKDQLARLAPPESEVRQAIENAAYPGRIMKFIVREYEEGMRGEVEIADVQFEHMAPKTPTEYWSNVVGTHDQIFYGRIVNNIGNIVPLDAATNIAGYNYDWPTKCKLYQENVPNWTVANIARENPDAWTPEKISKRASQIADWAVRQRWNLQEALNNLA